MTATRGLACGSLEAGAHQDSLTLLREVADYLSRLPAVPVTRELERKLRSHLADPAAQARERRVALLAADEAWIARAQAGSVFEGVSRYVPRGVPAVTARFLYPVLRLEAPAIVELATAVGQKQADQLATQIGQELAQGVEISLAPLKHVWPDRARR